MAKLIMICGRICCGKSRYADALRRSRSAVVLSVDEIMLSLFGQEAGEKHDIYTERIKKYLLEKSLEILGTGADVILDWGFWQRRERDSATSRNHPKDSAKNPLTEIADRHGKTAVMVLPIAAVVHNLRE